MMRIVIRNAVLEADIPQLFEIDHVRFGFDQIGERLQSFAMRADGCHLSKLIGESDLNKKSEIKLMDLRIRT